MPDVSTSAEPEWLPFRPRVGRALVPERAERWLDDLRQVTIGGAARSVAWLEGGRALAVELAEGGCSRVWRLDLGSGELTPWTRDDGADEALAGALPDGRGVVVVRRRCATGRPVSAGAADGELVVLRAGSVGAPVAGAPPAHAAAAVGGLDLVVASRSGAEGATSLARLSAGGGPSPLGEVFGHVSAVAASPDGARLAWVEQPAPDSPSRVVVSSERAAGRLTLTGGDGSCSHVAFADERRVVVACTDAQPEAGAAGTDLYLVEVDASPAPSGLPPRERLTHANGYDGAPSVLGHWVAWVSERGAAGGSRNVVVARMRSR
jgi:hypothetical protein